MQRRRFFSILSCSAVLALALAACNTPPPRSIPTESRVVNAPPAPLAETIPAAPAADSYWIPGHWKWNGASYVWAHGHWEQPRAGMVYQRAYWTSQNGRWVYHAARWVTIAPQPGDSAVAVSVAVPPPRIDAIGAPHGPNEVWIPGYWRWVNGRHAWIAGHWEEARPGYFWAPGHWRKSGPNWVFAGGFWQHY